MKIFKTSIEYQCLTLKNHKTNRCAMTAEEALHTYYKGSGCSQPEIALNLQVSQSAIHNWLSGKTKIPMEHYPGISKLCGLKLSEILPETWKVTLSDEQH